MYKKTEKKKLLYKKCCKKANWNKNLIEQNKVYWKNLQMPRIMKDRLLTYIPYVNDLHYKTEKEKNNKSIIQ